MSNALPTTTFHLSRPGTAGIACGAHLKSALCLVHGDTARLSAPIGDLDQPAARHALHAAACHLLDQMSDPPRWVAHDLHPDYYSSRLAAELAAQLGVPTLAVQHHHAHLAAVCAEYDVNEPVLGLALDGTGWGSDGTIWGGELLRLDGAAFQRLGHLAPLALPGGDRAAREPWRMAAAVLHRLGRSDEIASRYASQPGAAQLATVLERKLNTPFTSSAGRCFDAAAGLLGVCAVQSFEAEAAMALQEWAEKYGAVAALKDGWQLAEAQLDMSPLLAKLADCRDAAYGAALFHATLAEALAHWLAQATATHHVDTVVLSGGCLLNRVLAENLNARLRTHSLRVLLPHRVSPHDGGIALGQAWVARQYESR
ncbi:MAG: carbamoyltransferase HypF [Nitrosomonadales bacterium]|nr:carbamoyltransferase HypF [Nitrosomonadales bacterium]